MATSTFSTALARVLAHEGGYTNHPSDPGGPTNFGITIYDYRKYVKPNANAADVRAMKVEEAKAIYRARYWDALACDELPAGLDYTLFDYGVNSGVGRAGKVLRRVLALPDDDWHVAADVLAAIARRDASALIVAVNDERLRFLQSLKTWPVFGKGWGSRVARVKSCSLALASRTALDDASARAPLPRVEASAKGHVTPPVSSRQIAQVGGGLAAALAAAGHWLAAHPLVTGGIVVGLIVVIGGVAYALTRRQRATFAARQEAPTPGAIYVPETKAA